MTNNDRTVKTEAQPVMIRYRLRHSSQSAFAATRPGSMQKVLESTHERVVECIQLVPQGARRPRADRCADSPTSTRRSSR
jgi:hypothetical protein